MLSGLTVALALVPEAIAFAFAFAAGVEPLIGLDGAFMLGITTAVIGGWRGMISGATGAMAVLNDLEEAVEISTTSGWPTTPDRRPSTP